MANRIKRITDKLNGNTTKLSKALEGIKKVANHNNKWYTKKWLTVDQVVSLVI